MYTSINGGEKRKIKFNQSWNCVEITAKVSILQIIISGMDHDAQTPIKLDIFKAQLIFYANVVASVAYFLKNRHFFQLINWCRQLKVSQHGRGIQLSLDAFGHPRRFLFCMQSATLGFWWGVTIRVAHFSHIISIIYLGGTNEGRRAESVSFGGIWISVWFG